MGFLLYAIVVVELGFPIRINPTCHPATPVLVSGKSGVGEKTTAVQR